MKSKKKKEFVFPSGSEFERTREKLSDPHYAGGNLALPSDASETDRAKYNICQSILRFKRVNNCQQKEIAAMIGVDEARISQILRGDIEHFTLDRLCNYAQKLYPHFTIEIKIA